MRSFLFSALAAATVVAATVTGFATDASAAARRPHQRAHVAPLVRQDPYRSFNTINPRGFSADPVDSYRWPPSGGAT